MGFIISGIKELQAAQVGDTVTLADKRVAATMRCPASRKRKSQVFAGLYPIGVPTNMILCVTRWKN